MYSDRPGVCLNIVVVGGGIAGISAAYALGKAGHHVTVVDKGAESPKTPRAVGCGPNMTKIMRQWGLASTLDGIAQVRSRVDWYSGSTAVPLGSMVLVQDIFRDFEAEWLQMDEAELWSVLKDGAKEAGVAFRFRTPVLYADSDTGYVLLQNGEQIYGDVIVAADGYNSTLRSAVTEEEEMPTEEEEYQYLILSFIVPTNTLEEEDDLKALIEESSAASIWIGERYVIQGNSVHQGRDYAITIQYKCNNSLGSITEGDWKTIRETIKASGIDMEKIDMRIQKLLCCATTIHPSVVFVRPSLETLLCEKSRIVLVGEAAHPTLPGERHSEPLSIEDAETLGNLLSRIQHKGQLSQLLGAYNEIRQPWCKFAVDYMHMNHAVLEAESGPSQEARDAKIRAMLVQIAGDHVDEELFKEVWGNELALFSYDAREKVEDWWGQYGSFIMRSPHRDSIVSSIAVSESVSQGST